MALPKGSIRSDPQRELGASRSQGGFWDSVPMPGWGRLPRGLGRRADRRRCRSWNQPETQGGSNNLQAVTKVFKISSNQRHFNLP